MSKRFNNKSLLLILGGLIVILLVTFLVKIPSQRSTLKEKIVDLDTSAVFKIEITPKGSEGMPFRFERESNKWKIRQDKIVAVPRKNAVQNLFSEVLSIRPQSLAAKDKSMWKEYELTDSLATRIKFLDKKGKVLSDLMVGKFTYKQVNDPYSYGGNNISGNSFVRLYRDENIYGVEGFLAFSFGGKFNDWRDKTLIRCDKKDITRISFSYPADSSFVLEKKDSIWVGANQPADSLKTVNYLNSLSYVDGNEFMDGFKPVSSPLFSINIEGNNLLNMTIKCYQGEEAEKYILNSSLNPDIFFSTGKKELFEKLFKPREYFSVAFGKKTK